MSAMRSDRLSDSPLFQRVEMNGLLPSNPLLYLSSRKKRSRDDDRIGAVFFPIIMTSRSRHRMTAWLGLVAMWLVVFAPLVSQLVASGRADEPVAALCSALHPSGASDAGNALVAQTSPAPVHLSHDDAFGACGYCHLLEHHVAMPTVAVAELPAALPLAGTAPPTLSIRFIPLGAFPSGRPRAPPVVS